MAPLLIKLSNRWQRTFFLPGPNQAISLEKGKNRTKSTSGPASFTFALYLGTLIGFGGVMLMRSPFISILDLSDTERDELFHSASVMGLISYKSAGGVIEITISDLIRSLGSMTNIEKLLDVFGKQVSIPWDPRAAPEEKVWFCVYDPSDERRLLRRIDEFGLATERAGHSWLLIDMFTFLMNGVLSTPTGKNFSKIRHV